MCSDDESLDGLSVSNPSFLHLSVKAFTSSVELNTIEAVWIESHVEVAAGGRVVSAFLD